jgi:hypothetical protein
MRLRRRDEHDYDWQRELSARAPEPLTVSAEAASTDSRERPIRRVITVAVGVSVVAIVFVGTWIKLFDSHPSGWQHTVSRIAGPLVLALSIASFADALRKRFKRIDKPE